jgi:hypothetical protein
MWYALFRGHWGGGTNVMLFRAIFTANVFDSSNRSSSVNEGLDIIVAAVDIVLNDKDDDDRDDDRDEK